MFTKGFSYLYKILEIWRIHSKKVIKLLEVLLCNLASTVIYWNSIFCTRSRGSKIRWFTNMIICCSSTAPLSIQTKITVLTNQWSWIDAASHVLSHCVWEIWTGSREAKTNLKTASAMGDRQILPKQTNRTDIGRGSSAILFDNRLWKVLEMIFR